MFIKYRDSIINTDHICHMSKEENSDGFVLLITYIGCSSLTYLEFKEEEERNELFKWISDNTVDKEFKVEQK